MIILGMIIDCDSVRLYDISLYIYKIFDTIFISKS